MYKFVRWLGSLVHEGIWALAHDRKVTPASTNLWVGASRCIKTRICDCVDARPAIAWPRRRGPEPVRNPHSLASWVFLMTLLGTTGAASVPEDAPLWNLAWILVLGTNSLGKGFIIAKFTAKGGTHGSNHKNTKTVYTCMRFHRPVCLQARRVGRACVSAPHMRRRRCASKLRRMNPFRVRGPHSDYAGHVVHG